ncbi:MAG TPA: 3-dehydroquinate synthase [Candidatus Scybalocola faecavium]|nr:3-dehydroquinate synthase [Candidatus Scybalocola faecavium]
MKILTVHDQDKPIYDIVFSEDFNQLPKALASLGLSQRRVCIVSETRVAGLYLDTLKSIFTPLARQVIDFVFPEGEENKNLSTVQMLYERLIQAHFDRKDLLVALGGGVVGDLTGYSAATYLRGIDFIQVPTSLLAQVDSSIGGKTGVDFNAYKNMVGAFYQPKLVYMNFSLLKSLNDRQFFSGMGEIIKHGLIKDMDYYEWIKSHHAQILAREVSVLSDLVYRSCQIKKDVVEHDPKEKGERALLNFGHTIGHAVEKLENFSLLHGECVALGMASAAYISWQRGGISHDMYEDVIRTLVRFALPVKLPAAGPLTAEGILQATKLDKKMEAGAVKFILLSPAGHGIIDKTVTNEQIKAGAYSIGAV